ncbi:MAG: secretin N-terminal domain-containing protein [Candidatus Omnitrophota bacterium]
MRRSKFFISVIVFIFTFSHPSVYSEQVSEGKMPYVKPGNVTVNFKDADIRAVLSYLSEVSGIDIVPSPEVTGPITLKLTNKPWELALNIIAKNYGYAYEREKDIIRVVTLTSLKLEELSTEVIFLNYANAEEVQEGIKDMLTERGKLTYDSRINALIVTDLATNIYKVKHVIGRLDKKTSQIMIEAKIIETTLNKTERLGIDWNMVIALSGARRPTTIPFVAFQPDWGLHSKVIPKFFPVGTTGTETVTTPQGDIVQIAGDTGDFPIDATLANFASRAFPFVGTDAFTYGTLDFSQFSLVLEYLKSRSDIDIISNPRITTLNNRKATMFVGRVHPYISKIDEDEDAGTVKYEYKEKEIGIRLEVTPHINENGDIEVELKPEIKDIIGYQSLTEWFSLPIFSTREAETQVMVRDGDTIFLGGMIKENMKEYTKKFPILGDLFGGIPLIGNIFKYKQESKSKTELIFFLTVHLVKDVKELTRIATEDMSQIYIPLDIGGEPTELLPEELPEKVARQIPASLPKKRKPLFDFRKKKK